MQLHQLTKAINYTVQNADVTVLGSKSIVTLHYNAI